MSEEKNETDGPPKEEPQPVPNEEQQPQEQPKEGEQPAPENPEPTEQKAQPEPEAQQPVEEKKEGEQTEKKASKPPTSQSNAKRPASKSKKKETIKGNAKGRPTTSKNKKGKKGKEKEQAEKEAEEKRLEEQRLEEERLKKEEEERIKKEEEERLKKEEEERIRLEEEKKRQQEEEEDKRVLYLVQQLIDCSFIKDKDDERLSEEIVNKLFDFLDKPSLVQLYIKYKDDQEKELICRENILELYDPTVNKDLAEGIGPGNPNFISRSDYEFCFFLKKKPCRITKRNMQEQVVFDKVDGSIDKYLLDKMKENLSDRIFSLNWPEGIKNDLISNMHKFLIILNQSYFQELNKVVLYIPRENVSGSEASKDKELVARLESIMIEWTNQIRDFLSNQDNASNREDFDINEEIAYLESRNSNLAAISDQLENKELTDIVNTLSKTRASSENLKGFKDLKDKILEQKYIN